jgi:type I restriction enzyme M protein
VSKLIVLNNQDTLLRRLECVLAPTKPKVLKEYDKRKDFDLPLDAFLKKAAKLPFYNTLKERMVSEHVR